MPETKEATEVYSSWPIEELVEYIVSKHHCYVEGEVPVLRQYLKKLCCVHGEENPELFEITELFNQSASDLLFHMKKEEMILFPYIREMVKASAAGEKVQAPPFKTVMMPVKMMLEDHQAEEDRFNKISELSNHYALPPDACSAYKATFEMLNHFESDLHTHIHLENEILFPKAVELEKSLTS